MIDKTQKNIFITGSSGFVASQLIPYLEVSNLKIFKSSQTKRSDAFSYDELSADLLNDLQIESFIHLAGKAHDVKNTTDDQEYYNINAHLTNRIFDYFLNSNCKSFIFISSVKAAADRVEGILEEDFTPKPQTAYGKSKLAAETYLLSKKLPKGKTLIILRPCMIHGPKNKGNLNLLYKMIALRVPYPLGAFNNERSFLSVGNFNFIIRAIIESNEIKSGVYQVADDGFISTDSLVKLMGDVTNKKLVSLHLSKSLVRTIARLGDILSLPLNSDRLQKLTENYRVSNSKIKIALNIEKLPIPVAEGLINTLNSFNKN